MRVAFTLSRLVFVGVASIGPWHAAPAYAASVVPQLQCQDGLATSAWVRCTSAQKLDYTVDKPTGATLADFSGAGYHGGGVRLPSLPTRQTLKPSGGDDTAAIQKALNAVGSRGADANGWRGRVVLAPGTFTLRSGLVIKQSGVVLEGSASVGPSRTLIKYTGSAKTPVLSFVGADKARTKPSRWAVENKAVPAGSLTLPMQHTSGLTKGARVQLTVSHNLAWIKQTWGGHYPPVRNGQKQVAWGEELSQQLIRTVTKVTDDSVTLDAPLPDAIVAPKYAGTGGAFLQVVDTSNELHEFGAAHFAAQGKFVNGQVLDATQLTLISVANAEDGFFDDIVASDFGAGFVQLEQTSQRVTIQDMTMNRTGDQPGSAKPADISLRGQQALVQGCLSNSNKTFLAMTAGTEAMGPIVVQNYRTTGAGTFEPHMRWSTGILFDNVYIPKGGIAFIDRATAGTGQGWGAGYSVAYNSLAGTSNTQKMGMDAAPGITIEQPPGAANWGIGLVGPDHSSAKSDRRDSAGKPVGPASLWAYQLALAKGAAALNTVMGPWHVRDSSGKNCWTATHAKPGSTVSAVACKTAGQRALWDITSRGAIRLGGTQLCLAPEADKSGAAVHVSACDGDAAQHWTIANRAGAPTSIALASSTGGQKTELCIVAHGDALALGDCQAKEQPWQLHVTTLAR